MFSFLKDHPFAVEAHFESSAVLTFAAPKAELQRLIPECLELDVFDDRWAFVAVALVQTRSLRPKALPAFFGSDFFLIGYRVFVRYTNSSGKRSRGLFILRSETDRKLMEFLGSIFTQYRYATTDIAQTRNGAFTSVVSASSSLAIEYETGGEDIPLPPDSPFANWKEARRFAGPLPFTFTFQKDKNRVLIIEGVRKGWNPQPIKVTRHEIPFLDSLALNGLHLANAFIIRDVPYFWKKGTVDKWSK